MNMTNKALAKYAVTGILEGTYHASRATELARVAELAARSCPDVVADAAVVCRERGMAEVPAFLVAHLAACDVVTMSRVFPRVIDDGRMLRAFVQIVRSGVTGRKSFGSAPKRAIREWFGARSPDVVFRQSIGQSPSMSDVIKMVRPPPRNDQGEADAVREALYGYLIGKNVDVSKLPPLAKAFESFRRGTGPVPDVPFEMLTALPLRAEHWAELATKMTLADLRDNLDVLRDHGVLDDAAMVESIAARLEDVQAIRRGRVMPMSMLLASKEPRVPYAIVRALEIGLAHALANVPRLFGRVVVLADASVAMRRAIDGVRLADVAALAVRAWGGPEIVTYAGEPAPLRRVEHADVVVVLSDREAWADFRAVGPASMASAWRSLRERNPNAKLVLVDLDPYDTDEPACEDDVLRVGGFSDAVFDVVASFVNSN
jgi:60 kDa SS-A/Ro ribonucleoprotein